MDTAANLFPSTPLASASLPDTFKKPVRTPEQVQHSAKDFESVFLSQMMESMFEGTSVSGWEGEDGQDGGEEIYRSWLVEQYGKLFAEHGGIGLSSAVRNEMMKLQEVKP